MFKNPYNHKIVKTKEIDLVDMSTAAEFILWLLAVLLSCAIIVYFMKYANSEREIRSEGFTVRTCPRITSGISVIETKPFISVNGDTNCCNGDVVGGLCTGNIYCSLSPQPAGSSISTCANVFKIEGLRKCSNYVTGSGATLKTYSKYYVKSNGEIGCATATTDDHKSPTATADFCVLRAANPPGPGITCHNLMSSTFCTTTLSGDLNIYYSSSDGAIKGCSSSTNLNTDNTRILDSSRPHCRIYTETAKNDSEYNSCKNYKTRFTAATAACIASSAPPAAAPPAEAPRAAASPQPPSPSCVSGGAAAQAQAAGQAAALAAAMAARSSAR
jgi:hypothetical protein